MPFSHEKRLLFRLTLWVGMTALMCATLTACGSKAEEPSISAHAVLDPALGSITLPLAEYGMSLREEYMVTAAQAVLLWRCVEGTDALSAPAVANAKAILSSSLIRPQWLYGYWDAPLLASHGVDPKIDWIPPGPMGVDPDLALACRATDEFKGIGFVTTSWADTDPASAANQLIRYSMEAYLSTLSDSRVLALSDTRKACVEAQGYLIEGDDLGEVYIDPSWSEEQTMSAFLVAAVCSDELDFTQQAGDINATYEQQIIDAHQAELVAIKQIADERVATATRILQDAGLM